MEYLGLIFEFIFLGMGIYLYLFSIGKMQAGTEEARKKAEAFREKNGWLRFAAMALTAIMAVNIYLHIMQLMGKG
ncbi:MAG: hypothetical protein MI974_21045 [Chitinophagales bacterium]|nr:hypothetical protein [Chitinophagales bacterium]